MPPSSPSPSPTPDSLGPGLPAIDPALPYEQAQQELEGIIRRIESGQIGLEEQLAAYQRGVALHRHCQGLLARFEQQFTDLTAQLNAAGPDKSQDPATNERD